jgi:hypothetical protein
LGCGRWIGNVIMGEEDWSGEATTQEMPEKDKEQILSQSLQKE